jgi:hypothetical protein
VVGWLRPIVLIPLSTLTTLSPQQLDAVILHELAHIRRLDAFANLFQILVETSLFYHPAVWWVSHRIRIERENCCDDIAVSVNGDSFGYAMALTMLEAERSLPDLAMAATGGALKNRVKRLLGQEAAPSRPYHLAALAVALIVAIFGTGALQAMAGAPHTPAPVTAMAPVAPPEPVSLAVAAPEAPAAPAAPAARAKRASAAQRSEPAETAESGGSYIGDMAQAGYRELSSGQLIALKSVGVTPEEAAEWYRSGLAPSAGLLVSLHAAGVRPADAVGMRDAGLKGLALGELTSLRSVGVTPDYVRRMREAGFESDKAHEFVTARSVGVTPEFVAKLKKSGVADLAPHRIITLKSSGLD